MITSLTLNWFSNLLVLFGQITTLEELRLNITYTDSIRLKFNSYTCTLSSTGPSYWLLACLLIYSKLWLKLSRNDLLNDNNNKELLPGTGGNWFDLINPRPLTHRIIKKQIHNAVPTHSLTHARAPGGGSCSSPFLPISNLSLFNFQGNEGMRVIMGYVLSLCMSVRVRGWKGGLLCTWGLYTHMCACVSNVKRSNVFFIRQALINSLAEPV